MAQHTRIHFIGIGGIGMSGLARICLAAGKPVSGSDVVENDNTKALAAAGAVVFIGHAASNIPLDAAKVVVTSAISSENEELKEAKRRNLPVCHRSDLLAEMFLDANIGIAVAGCHGKTTVSSMISTMLVEAGQDPTCVVGGYVPAIGGNARAGRSGLFVAEADESDASFLKYFPHSAVITNIDNDHLDHYESLDAIIKAFEIFVEHIDPRGTLYLCTDDSIAKNMSLPRERRIITYGISNPADIMAGEIELQPFGSRFTLIIGGVLRGVFELSVPGRHNVLNALPVIAFGLDIGLTIRQIQEGLRRFHGAGRRFELKGTFDGVTVIDDYGHHPSEIRATLAAARSLNANKVIVVFQPHRYTRTQLLSQEFGRSFKDCDKLFIMDIYPASEKPIPGVSNKLILEQMPVSERRKVKLVKNNDDLAFQIMQTLEPGDVVFTLGAGNVTKFGPELLGRMQDRAHQLAEITAQPAV